MSDEPLRLVCDEIDADADAALPPGIWEQLSPETKTAMIAGGVTENADYMRRAFPRD